MHYRMLDCKDQFPVVMCDANAETKGCRYFKKYVVSHPSLLPEMLPNVSAVCEARISVLHHRLSPSDRRDFMSAPLLCIPPTDHINSIPNASANVLDLEIRIVIPDYFLKRKPLAHQLKDGHHRNSGTSNTWFPKMNVWINLNSFSHHISPDRRICVAAQ